MSFYLFSESFKTLLRLRCKVGLISFTPISGLSYVCGIPVQYSLQLKNKTSGKDCLYFCCIAGLLAIKILQGG